MALNALGKWECIIEIGENCDAYGNRIAIGVAISHGGDLEISRNNPLIGFSGNVKSIGVKVFRGVAIYLGMGVTNVSNEIAQCGNIPDRNNTFRAYLYVRIITNPEFAILRFYQGVQSRGANL